MKLRLWQTRPFYFLQGSAQKMWDQALLHDGVPYPVTWANHLNGLHLMSQTNKVTETSSAGFQTLVFQRQQNIDCLQIDLLTCFLRIKAVLVC